MVMAQVNWEQDPGLRLLVNGKGERRRQRRGSIDS
jgi:hypothetical protein